MVDADHAATRRVLVTGFCDWAVTDPPSSEWRCFCNPSGRLLIGNEPSAMESTRALAELRNAGMYRGLLCQHLNKVTSVTDESGNRVPVVWDYVVAPVVWRQPLQELEAYDRSQSPFSRVRDLESYHTVVHLGLGSYAPPWPFLLELGALDGASVSKDARGLYPDGSSECDQHEPIRQTIDDGRTFAIKSFRNSDGQLQSQITSRTAVVSPPLNELMPHPDSRVKHKICAIAGASTKSQLPHPVVAALPRVVSKFICNQANWHGLTLMNRAFESRSLPERGPAESYFIHIPWGNSPGKAAPDANRDFSSHIHDDFTDLSVAAADVILNIVDFHGRGFQDQPLSSLDQIVADMSNYNLYGGK
ncbi:unnamed protein product [Polarella glacialis]|uniref:Uncharacterized protein n=1 Tax=Polarella glacialis TaxID=89957 RepID=A0A813FB30_POLGL|nr:unnamed protein product [Polarella glacialis]